MTIVEAISCVLQESKKGMTSLEIYKKIVKEGAICIWCKTTSCSGKWTNTETLFRFRFSNSISDKNV